MAKNKPLAFVVMPFTRAVSKKNGSYQDLGSEELDTVFSLIEEVLNRRFDVKRAESPTDILRDIVLDLDRAELVVADLTSLNPNVMYELGIRHGFCKKTILITQDRSELPFDIAGYHCLEYKWITQTNKKKFKEDLNNTLSLIEKHEDPRYGPVHTHLGIKLYGYREVEHVNSIKRLKGLFIEIGWLVSSVDLAISGLSTKFPDVIISKNGGRDYEINEDNMTPEVMAEIEKVASPPQSMPCVDLLISENYIPEEYNVHGEVDHFVHVLLTLRNSRMYTSHMDGGFHKVIGRVMKQVLVHTVQLITALDKKLAGEKIFEIQSDIPREIVDSLRGVRDAP